MILELGKTNDNLELIYHILIRLRLTAIESDNEILNNLIEFGIIQYLTKILDANITKLIYESLWILINLSTIGIHVTDIMKGMKLHYKIFNLMKISKDEDKTLVIFLL